MIRNEQILQGLNQEVRNALNYLDFAIGSRLDLQVLISGDQEKETFDALVLQGGKLQDVNKAREAANLHKINPRFNNKLIQKEWIELLQENKGVVFVGLNGFNRTKNAGAITSGIDATKERNEKIHFDAIEGPSFDVFFVYLQEEGTQKKKRSGSRKKAEDKAEGETEKATD